MKQILFLMILLSITLTSCIRGDKYSRKKYYDHSSRRYKYYKETPSDKENHIKANNQKPSSHSSENKEKHFPHNNKNEKKPSVNYEEEEVPKYKIYRHKRYGY